MRFEGGSRLARLEQLVKVNSPGRRAGVFFKLSLADRPADGKLPMGTAN